MRFEPAGRHLAAGGAVLLVLVAQGFGAAAHTAAPQRDTLMVDFRALNANGDPVTDLKPGDLVLRVGGRERRLASLDLVSRASSGPDPGVALPFATNSATLPVHGDILLLIDEGSIAPGREQPVRDAITSLLTRTPPRARVRMISLRRGGPALPFEEGLRDVKAAVARFSGHSTVAETEDDLVCRTRNSLEILEATLARYSGGPVPTVVIVSGGLGGPPTGGVTSFGNYGKCPVLQSDDFERIGAAARAINAASYVVHLTESTASRLGRLVLERGVDTLAGTLDARVIRDAAPSDAAMARIAAQTSAYYLAGFEPDAEDRADSPLRVELRSRRSDVNVRVRQEIAGPRSAVSGGAALPTPDGMIRVATGYRGVALRAEGFVSRPDDEGKVRLLALFEPEDPATKVTAASIGLYDVKGRLTRWTAEPADLVGRPLVAGIIVPPGVYRMRVAASTGTAVGAVDTEVRAELATAGPVTTSALLVGVSGPNGFAPRLQFSASDTGAFGYLEIYQVAKNAALTVTLELAATADSPALVTGDVPLTTGSRDDVRVAFSGFAIDGMPPGDIVMRAIVNMDGKPVARTYRTVRKVK